jgi:NAD(P)-dependent dehydrogenase (short-subunit alcohol dehydrogenase family)
VTGASSGIGAALAQRLTADGWRVVGVDRRPTQWDDAAAMAENGSGLEVLTGDAADPDLLGQALGRVGDKLDGLACSAAIPPTGPWDDREAWDEVLRVNLTAAYEAFRVAHSALVAARGSVVLMGSIVGSAEGSRRSPAYAAAKAGLEGLARSLALVGAPDGIRVNVLAIGAVDTPFDTALAPANARPDVPLGRMARPEEIASAAAFLLSPDAAYVTGSVWRIDGGRTVLSGIDVALSGH